jgi:prepilin-type N-terminal cleavage/methylation domain-containing protein
VLLAFLSVENRPGFSLMELLIAVTIMGIISLGITSLFSAMNSQLFGVSIKFDQFQLSTRIEGALRNQASCKGIMNLPENNVQIPNSTPTSVKNLNRIAHFNESGVIINDIVPSLNTEIPGTRLQVTSITLTEPANPASGPLLAGSAIGSSRTYLADLIIAMKHNSTSFPQFRPITIQGLIVTVNSASNTVESCSWNTVREPFFQNGNEFGSAGTLGTNDNFGLILETNNQPRLTITHDGKVGIGVLNPNVAFETSGPIKPGPATEGSSCLPSEVGSVAVDSVSHKILVCK